MYVAQIMTPTPDVATGDMKLSHAAQLMRENNRRFLPVVDDQQKLIGLLTHREMSQAEPSAITTLSVGEVNYLTSKITVSQIMQQQPVSCCADTLVEEAGRLMRENRAGCLPVLESGKLVGIITETDLLDFFLDITGCNLPDSARIEVHLEDSKGNLGDFLDHINELGGYIATVVSPISPDKTGKRIVIVRYRADDPVALDRRLGELGYELITEKLP
ncbi:MAG: CBS domain-containing protein [Chromatiales bacterium]|nr:CBS domain-containing protein [Chromatiales bacterium]